MKKLNKLLISCLLLSVLFLTLGQQEGYADDGSLELMIDIVNQKGEKIGKASFSQKGDQVHLRIKAKNLTPGKHGIHFHETGRCDSPDFTTAGSHFNPTNKKHGYENSKGFHAGD